MVGWKGLVKEDGPEFADCGCSVCRGVSPLEEANREGIIEEERESEESGGS